MALVKLRNLVRGYDWPLFVSALLLVFLGLSVIYSTSLTSGLERFEKQLLAVGLGLVVLFVFSRLDYRRLGSLAWYLYGLCLLLLLGVLIFGTNLRGTTGWFTWGDFSLQPVEFVKVLMVLVLAHYLARVEEVGLRSWWQSFLIILPILILLAWQPDYGPIFILLSLWLVFNIMRGLSIRNWLGLAGLAAALILISYFLVLPPDQKARFITFVRPSEDPTGSGFQVRQSIIAVGAGGLTGAGLGEGVQSQLRFLPEAPTDFVFASLLEQLGLVGFLILLVLWGVLFWRIFRMLFSAKDNFTQLTTLGLGWLLFGQTAVNVAMNLGLAPIIGLPLPFLSYGGSALVAEFLLLGLLESIVIRQQLT